MLFNLIHTRYLKLVRIDPQTLLKITLNKPTSVTQINPQNYLKHYSKLILKALLKLKNFTCKDCTIKALNKTKQTL